MNTTVRLIWNRVAAYLLIAICTITLAGPAAAEGWYIGGSIGQTEVDIDCDLNITCSADDSDTGFKIFGGKQSNRLAIEFGYVDFGKFTASGIDSFLGNASLSVEATALFATVNGVFPVGKRVNLIPKVGLHRWDLDFDASSSVFGSGSDSDDGIDFLIGFGASFDVGERAAIRVEWERFANVGDEDTTGESDVDMLSVGVTYKFSSAK